MRTPSKLFAICLAVSCLGVVLIAGSAQAAAPAWAPIAVSGPTNLPPLQSETQRIGIDAEGGDFTLAYTSAKGSGNIVGLSLTGSLSVGSNTVSPPTGEFTIGVVGGAPAVGQEIAGPGIPDGTTIVGITEFFGIVSSLTLSANAEQTSSTVSLQAGLRQVSGVAVSSGAFMVGDTIAASGLPSGTTVTACAPSCGAATELTISTLPTASGSKALTATETTDPIAYDADPGTVESALNALPAIGGSVSVAGGPGGPGAEHPYLVTFGGSLSDVDVANLSANDEALAGAAHSATVVVTVPGGPGTTTISFYAQNVGGESSSGPITVSVELPAGVTTAETPAAGVTPDPWTCTPGAGQSAFTCTSNGSVVPGEVEVPVHAKVVTSVSTSADLQVQMTVSGGGAADSASYSMPLKVSAAPAEPGIQSFTAGAYDDEGKLDTRAGGHPYSGSTAIFANTYRNHFGNVVPVGEFKDIEVDLPPGFLGNPIATPQCPEKQLALSGNDPNFCPKDTIIGRVGVILGAFGGRGTNVPVYDVEAPYGYPGKFFFNVLGVEVHAIGSVRSDGDYGLTVGSVDTVQVANIYGTFFTFWGVPSDSSHDVQRCSTFSSGVCSPPVPSSAPRTAFLTSPTDCAGEAAEPPFARLRLTTWQSPLVTHVADFPVPAVTGCDQLKFDADFKFEPSETKSDSPASFRTELTVPSEGLTNPDKLMTPTIKKAEVELPEGVVLNASAADGLAACSEQQIGLRGTNFPAPNPIRFSKAPQTCPDASKIGTGELKSELLEEPLHGDLYLAAQGNGNPFGSLFALYLVIEDPRHGIFIKLPAEVRVNQVTGQQRVVFPYTPPLPFSYLRLTLKGGDRSPLASPTTCGTFTTNSINTPWSYPESGPPTTSSNGFAINQGPNGQPCAPTKADRPFDVGLSAGTDSADAGKFSTLRFRITRPDGSQELDKLELTTAPGLAASLAGIERCSGAELDAAASKRGREEQSNPSCPSSSEIGRVVTGAGSGSHPFYADGKLYLAGPYEGAPLSVVAITPAVAGPFDLGNVVVRTAVFIDRSTAQVTAKSDPIPQILEGVPLRIKDVRVILDRSNFTLNPTSCDEMAISAHLAGNSGAAKDLTSRFQVGGCGDLAFKPKFWSRVKGGTKRGAHPQFLAKVSWPQGNYANTKNFQVTLPHSEFLDQAHIRTICTRVQALADKCPPGSIYGYAEARTPLLDESLKGPVFLKSSSHKLPDLAIKLRGPDSMPIEVEFAGRIDSIKSQIRNTIENLPDVPVSSFFLKMRGGKKGLLINSRNLCTTRKVRVDVQATGQNNSATHLRPVLHNSCPKVRKHKRHHESHHRRSNRGKR